MMAVEMEGRAWFNWEKVLLLGTSTILHLAELSLTSSRTVHNGLPVPGSRQEARHRYRIPKRTCWLVISSDALLLV